MAGLRFAVLAVALCMGAAHAELGSLAEISWAPWSAQVVPVEPGTICVGAIVGKSKVLTAASCVPEGKPFTVVVGATKWSKGGETHTVKSVSHHHGIAVLDLDTDLSFNANIQAIQVADKKPKDNTHVLSAGWCVNKGEPLLRKIVMSSMPAKLCDKEVFCTKVEKGETCKGDIGSGVWTVPIADRPASIGMAPMAGTPARLIGILSPEGAEANLPHFVDLTNKEVREFLQTQQVVKTGWF